MELDFVVTQQKNANIWEEMEDLRDKYEIEVNRCKTLKVKEANNESESSANAININTAIMEDSELFCTILPRFY